jgi:hypothetical protein
MGMFSRDKNVVDLCPLSLGCRIEIYYRPDLIPAIVLPVNDQG